MLWTSELFLKSLLSLLLVQVTHCMINVLFLALIKPVYILLPQNQWMKKGCWWWWWQFVEHWYIHAATARSFRFQKTKKKLDESGWKNEVVDNNGDASCLNTCHVCFVWQNNFCLTLIFIRPIYVYLLLLEKQWLKKWVCGWLWWCHLLKWPSCVCGRTMSPLAELYTTSTMEHHHFDQCIMILSTKVTTTHYCTKKNLLQSWLPEPLKNRCNH